MGRRDRWTDGEDFLLRKLYSVLTDHELAKLLNERYGYGRNATSVRHHARRLGLRKAASR